MVLATISKNCLFAIDLEHIPLTAGEASSVPKPQKETNENPPQIETSRKSTANDPRIVFTSIYKQLERRKIQPTPKSTKIHDLPNNSWAHRRKCPKGALLTQINRAMFHPSQSQNYPKVARLTVSNLLQSHTKCSCATGSKHRGHLSSISISLERDQFPR